MSAAAIQELLETGKYSIIDKDVYRSMLEKIRQDIRKKICSAAEARYILSMTEKKFYEHIAKKECLVRPSKLKGKYVLSSVYDEAKRLNKEP